MKNITHLSRGLAPSWLGCCALILIAASAGCSVASYSVREAVKKPNVLDQRNIAIDGYLCVDGTEIYLASSTICDVLEEQKANEFMIPLVLNPENITIARKLDRTNVEVQGVFHAPPHDAAVLKNGLLLGFFIEGNSIRAKQ